MKVSEQCSQIVAMIQRNITYKERGLILRLYKAIVVHHLGYCIQAWRQEGHWYICLNNRQRRATKLILGLRDIRYVERLKECGITTYEMRRLREIKYKLFKILNDPENIYPNTSVP